MFNYAISESPMRTALGILTLLLVPLGAGQAQDRSRMEITLERKEGSAWKSVDPTLVLASGDVVRFRFKSNFDGYLYVTNLGTSGEYSLLFPREETGSKNLLEAGKEYMVPATEAIFRISGPAGYESVYWLVSPVSLGKRPELAPVKPAQHKPPVLMPRCDPTLLRARSLCLDTEAGPRQVGEKQALPSELGALRATTREITIVQQQNQSVLSAGKPSAPVLYEFRLAHK